MESIKNILTQFKSIELHIWDKVFILSFTIFVVWLFFTGMSILTFGGIVLIYGAFLTYKGQIFLSVGSYLLADFSWVLNAYFNDDLQGVIFISIGIVFGVIATHKMHSGKMKKHLNH